MVYLSFDFRVFQNFVAMFSQQWYRIFAMAAKIFCPDRLTSYQVPAYEQRQYTNTKPLNQRKFYKTGNLRIVKSLSNILGLSDKRNTFVEPISN